MAGKKRVRIWNSEVAYRIDSQLPTPWDRSIFRKLISQNELDESQLRGLLKRWRRSGNRQSFCEFLADAGIVSIEMRTVISWGSTTIDPDQDCVHVSLTQPAALEIEEAIDFVGLIRQFVNRMRRCICPMRGRSHTASLLRHVDACEGKSEPSFECRTSNQSLASAVATTDEEFDPYATIY